MRRAGCASKQFECFPIHIWWSLCKTAVLLIPPSCGGLPFPPLEMRNPVWTVGFFFVCLFLGFFVFCFFFFVCFLWGNTRRKPAGGFMKHLPGQNFLAPFSREDANSSQRQWSLQWWRACVLFMGSKQQSTPPSLPRGELSTEQELQPGDWVPDNLPCNHIAAHLPHPICPWDNHRTALQKWSVW